ncbi:hypothetical protein D3C71_1294030 [compost metagenome]
MRVVWKYDYHSVIMFSLQEKSDSSVSFSRLIDSVIRYCYCDHGRTSTQGKEVEKMLKSSFKENSFSAWNSNL